jgi:hypothetical protein
MAIKDCRFLITGVGPDLGAGAAQRLVFGGAKIVCQMVSISDSQFWLTC